MPGNKLIDIDKGGDGLRTRQVTNLNEIIATSLSIYAFKILLDDNMNFVFNRRMLGKASTEFSSSYGFTNKLNCHPSVAERLLFTQILGDGPSANLRNDAKQLVISKRNLNKATNLTDSVTMPINED